MQFTEAFAALGYRLQVHRTDWTAANESGVCISLWQKQIQRHPGGRPWHDTDLQGREHAIWKDKPGNRKRIEHIRAAMEKQDGFVDVVIVNGEPGESYGDAHPWFLEKRRGYRWRITQFDEATGHFRVEAQEPLASQAQQ